MRGARLGPALLVAAAACSAPEYGELPARCSDGACPEGYECIHGVCAEPGAPVPITVARLENLLGEDLKLIPQQGGVLVVWQTYAYSPEGQRFRGARVGPGGDVSPVMDLVTSFVADEGAVEPFYDVLARSDEELLLAVSASPLPDDESPSARLLTYRVRLPPAGQEARGVQFEAAWPAEERMDTAGYGAVSQPKLLSRGDRVELGYVRTRVPGGVPASDVVAELGVFPLSPDGAQLAPPTYVPVRAGLPLAVGVAAAFATGDAAFWVLDDARPSAVLIPDGGAPAEVHLERLGVAVEAAAGSLLYLQPSARTGDKLSTDPVAGEAALHRIEASPAAGDPPFTFSDAPVGEIGVVRDTPRPVWIPREGRTALLVTPGASIDAPSLLVYQVDPATGASSFVTGIDRMASSEIGGVAAALAGGNLHVAWIDAADAAATIRVAIIPEP